MNDNLKPKGEESYRFRKAVSGDEIIALAAQILEGRLRRLETLGNPEETKQFLSYRIGPLEHEVFLCLFLDNRHRVIAVEELFRGTIDGASVHPREVVKAVLRHNAAAVIFAHNHPSGVAEPSLADKALTERLQEACALVDVRVIDHIVIAGMESASLASRGLL